VCSYVRNRIDPGRVPRAALDAEEGRSSPLLPSLLTGRSSTVIGDIKGRDGRVTAGGGLRGWLSHLKQSYVHLVRVYEYESRSVTVYPSTCLPSCYGTCILTSASLGMGQTEGFNPAREGYPEERDDWPRRPATRHPSKLCTTARWQAHNGRRVTCDRDRRRVLLDVIYCRLT
jgi:hypothetical protein